MDERAHEYREIIPQLFAFQRGFDGGKIRTSHVKVAHIAHGWYRRVVRGVAAVLTLEEAGYVGEAPPMRRSILEHNVALGWVAEEGNNILDPISRGHKFATEKLRDKLLEKGWSGESLAQFAEVLESVGSPDQHQDNLLQFATRVSRYGTLDDAIQVITETGLTHATYESAVAYFDSETQQVTEHAERVVDQAPFAVTQLGLGIANFMRIFEDPPKEPVLDFAEIGIRIREIDRRYRLANGLTVPSEYGDDENSPIPGMWDEPEDVDKA
jgi:hypothetical protein